MDPQQQRDGAQQDPSPQYGGSYTPQPQTPQSRSVPLRNRLKNISSTVLLIITAPLLAIFITSHVFHSYEVDGSSMETTLQNGDRLLVYKLPKTIANITGGEYLPARWDVVIFDRPSQIKAPNSVKHLIKRVIGLPGERVVVRDGVVTVYNNDNPGGFNPDSTQEYADGFEKTPGTTDVTVGADEIFVLGDNRNNSTDSRVFGPIPIKLLVGNATARFVPVDGMRKL